MFYLNFRTNIPIIDNSKDQILDMVDNQLLIPGNYNNRPNCEEILEFIRKLRLKENEIKEYKIYDTIEEKLSNEDIFFLNYMESKNPFKSFNDLQRQMNQSDSNSSGSLIELSRRYNITLNELQEILAFKKNITEKFKTEFSEVSTISRGGFGEVFKVMDKSGNEYAIKMICK